MSAGPTGPASVPEPKVFITYRREETAAHAGRLYDAMVARFGEGNVFMDVDMAPGVDFVERITEAVAACHVLIVVMGPKWATVKDEQGRARLADPEDFVRLEVETALQRSDVTPIPVLVAGARMPNREDLPPEVRAITRRNALELSDQRWRYDVGRLISTLEELLAESPLAPSPSSPERGVATGKAAAANAAQASGETTPSTVAATTSMERKPAAPPAVAGRRVRWALVGAGAIAVIVVVVVLATDGGGRDGANEGAAEYQEPPLLDPLPDPVSSAVGLTVQEFATFPQSTPAPAPTDPRLMRWARINYLGEMPDGSGRLYVPDLNGMLYLVEDGQIQPYLDVGAAFAPDFLSGRGLGSGFGFVTFHPEFAENGKFYTVHSEWEGALIKPTDLPTQPNTGFHGVITEWTADDPSANTFSGTRREMLRLGFTTQIHGIQQIDFNPTAKPDDGDYGLLYIGAGDGGAGVSTTQPQNLAVPQGKILRIDPLGTNGANGRYGVPSNNPFVNDPGVLGEIYAYGLRNPHRFSWDTDRPHRMFLGNMGQHRVESIYEVRAGDNFGWSEREGPFVFTNDDPDCNVFPLPPDDGQFHYTYPVAAYDHNVPPDAPCSDVGVAVIGGFVYRGDDVPELQGKYVFGDDVDGRLFFTNASDMRRSADKLATIHQFMLYDETGQRVTMQDLAGSPRVDLRFGQDGDGELYILSKANGIIWKVTGARDFAGCDVTGTTVTDVMDADNWAPVSPDKWEFPGTEVILAEPGVNPGRPRRPFEYAVLTAGPRFGSVRFNGEVRIDTPVEITNRDVIIVFGYRSATEFYYAHLSTDNTVYPLNGIFVVNNADRVRIEDQWDVDRSLGAPPAITDLEWHSARVVHCADSGEIAVYVDGAQQPLMTAVDTTFDSGRVGFGSFDNIGRLRELTVTGTAADD